MSNSKYKSSRIRSNLTFLLSDDEERKQKYISRLNPDCSILLQCEQVEEIIEQLHIYLKKGTNVVLNTGSMSSSERKQFVFALHNYCREQKIRCWFTCCLFKNANHKFEYPAVDEGWNDIWICTNNHDMKQININNNVIF